MIRKMAMLAAGLIAASEYERKHFRKVSYTVYTDKTINPWDGMKIIFLSDLHGNVFGKDNDLLVRAIEESKPDVILVGGDMMIVKEWSRPDFESITNLFKRLRDIAPVYYSLGNHEQRMKQERDTYPGWWDNYFKAVSETGTVFLINDSVTLEKEGSFVRISGMTLGSGFFRKFIRNSLPVNYVSKRIGDCHKDEFEILLAHNPLYFDDYVKWGADMILAGHFHGGTIRLPFFGGVMTPQINFFCPLDRGVHFRKNSAMIVSGGLGTHSINIRLNNRPQLVEVTLKVRDKVCNK